MNRCILNNVSRDEVIYTLRSERLFRKRRKRAILLFSGLALFGLLFSLCGCKVIHVHTPTKEYDEVEESFMGEEVDLVWDEESVDERGTVKTKTNRSQEGVIQIPSGKNNSPAF